MIDRDSTDIPMRRVAAMAAPRSAGYPACTVHDAFLSYNQAADGKVAAALEAGLERLAKPLFKLRAIDVFRDKTGLAASSGLRGSLEKHLSQSRWLVVLASPASAASPWCTFELNWWLQRHGMERLLIVLTDGELAWHRGGGGLDSARTTALPTALHERFAQEPLWVDLRWARGVEPLEPRRRAAAPGPAGPFGRHPQPAQGPARRRRRAPAARQTSPRGRGSGHDRPGRRCGHLAGGGSHAPTRPRADTGHSRRCRARSPRRPLHCWSATRGWRCNWRPSHEELPTPARAAAHCWPRCCLAVVALQQHESAWRALATHAPSGQWLMSDLRGGVYRSADGRSELQTLLPPREGLNLFASIRALAFSPDGKAWAYGGSGPRAGGARRRQDLRAGDRRQGRRDERQPDDPGPGLQPRRQPAGHGLEQRPGDAARVAHRPPPRAGQVCCATRRRWPSRPTADGWWPAAMAA